MGSLIDISAVEAQLEAFTATTDLEFSGFGWCVREVRGSDNVLVVYRIELMDVGSYGYTQINLTSEQIIRWASEPDVKNLKLWFHRHPANGWSGRDDHTARFEPLGSTPEMMKWAAAIVRTPRGWIGRIDTFGPKPETIHVPVVPNVSVFAIKTMNAILHAKEAARPKQPSFRPVKAVSSYAHATQPSLTAQQIKDITLSSEYGFDEEIEGLDELEGMVCSECDGEQFMVTGVGVVQCVSCGNAFRIEGLAPDEVLPSSRSSIGDFFAKFR